MNIIFSEHDQDYANYVFSYAVHAVARQGDALSLLYSSGFLPYTGAAEYQSDTPVREIYYLARSLRVSTQPFHLTSELRRIMRKTDSLDIQMTWHEKEDFVHDVAMHQFCTRYAAERYSSGDMAQERLDYLFHRQCLTHIVRCHLGDQLLGYVFVGVDEQSVHFWYSFYDTTWLDHFPLGKYLMLRIGQWAEAHGRDHLYLGTCYGAKSLYKVRDFKGVSFFSGSGWSEDIVRLKELCKADAR